MEKENCFFVCVFGCFICYLFVCLFCLLLNNSTDNVICPIAAESVLASVSIAVKRHMNKACHWGGSFILSDV